MKSYEEMAQNVMRRGKMYDMRKKHNRKIVAGISAFVCLCSVAVLGITGAGDVTLSTLPTGGINTDIPTVTDGDIHQIQQPTSETDVSKETQTVTVSKPGFVLLAAGSVEEPGTALTEGLSLPLNYCMRVRDLTGLSEAERNAAIGEERNLFDEKMNEGLNGAGQRLGSCTPQENYVISMIRNGCFRLRIEDYDAVTRIEIQSVTGFGKVDVCLSNLTYPRGQDVVLTPAEIPEMDRKNGLVINWDYSSAVLSVLDRDPGTPLTQFSDTVVFTLTYTDGTLQKCHVQIKILEDGQIVACQQGTITTM